MYEIQRTEQGIGYKLRRIWQFLSLMNVEVYIFFVMVSYTLKKIPSDQLVQDKICLLKYNQTNDYCRDLPTMTSAQDKHHMKSTILGDMTNFTITQTLIFTIPAVICAVFVGSWTDKYQGAKKSLMIAGAFCIVLENIVLMLNAYYFDKAHNYVLLALIPGCATGGLLSIFTALFAYVASTTPPKMRALRMMVAEIVLFVATPIGTYLGGLILNTKPTFKGGQLHNYSMVFIVGAVANLTAMIWVLFRVNERRDIRVFRERFDANEERNMQSKGQVVCDKQQQFDDNKHIHPLKLLFNLENVKDMWRTCSKPRTNYVRAQIWLLFLSMMCYLMAHMGTLVFLYPFVQKVYQWNSQTYSNASAIGNVISALSTLIIAPILIKVIKVKDTTLSMIGLGAYFSQNMIRGVWLNPSGFFVSLITGALGSVASVGIRTHFSKIVEPCELGKVFSLMSAIDSVSRIAYPIGRLGVVRGRGLKPIDQSEKSMTSQLKVM